VRWELESRSGAEALDVPVIGIEFDDLPVQAIGSPRRAVVRRARDRDRVQLPREGAVRTEVQPRAPRDRGEASVGEVFRRMVQPLEVIIGLRRQGSTLAAGSFWFLLGSRVARRAGETMTAVTRVSEALSRDRRR